MANTLAELIKERVKTWVKDLGAEDYLDESGDLLRMSFESAEALQKNNLQIMKMPKKEDLEPHLRDFEFNEFLAEPLLREGSLLLDRCLQERKEFEELHTKFFEACIQILELNELNNITSDEEDTYETHIKMAQADLAALENEQEGVKDAIERLENGLLKIVDGSPREIDRRNIEITAMARHSAHALAYGSAHDEQIKFGGTRKMIRVWAEEYAGAAEDFRGDKESVALKNQWVQLKGLNGSLLQKIEIAKQQIELKKNQMGDNGFQRRRNNVARFVALQRGEELRKLGGALNFQEQMKSVEIRLKNDLAAAKLRLKKASDGFRMLYGYSAFDESSERMFTKSYNEKGIYDREFDFDDLVTWTQVTNTWLAAFLDTQQQVTFSFSLKDLVKGAENFGKGIEERNGKFQGEWSFLLTSQDFYERKYVRMRSFSLQVDCGMKVGSWNFKITPPSKALNEPKKQDHVGTLFLGRVNERTYAVIPESAAPPKLYNISPIGENHTNDGKWKIEIASNSTAQTSIKDIVDIDIHLTVALL
ncbi:MAG: hypothetical protein K1X72_19940 [Pyrinomonadaceae bacterium]|nr:hypothetical protein [Pyrinomonadaceae bacterium]